jgi:hypothetical protein
MSGKVRVYITVDTETSMGGAWRNPAVTPMPLDIPVFGKCHSGQYGIPLIMDILEERGFRATFFTEVFCSYSVGPEAVANVLRYIRDRGHDAQLHLHPTYRFYRDFRAGGPRRETDLLHQLSPAEQADLIAEGVRLFVELCGKAPRAYRAGCYGASEESLAALHQNGIEIDSSYNLAYLGNTCEFQTTFLNAPAVINGVYEFPVTVFRVFGSPGYKPLEISAVSVAEIMGALRQLGESGCRDVVLVLHSFSLLKNLSARWEDSAPDQIVIRRLRRLCAALSELRGEVEVRTLGDVELRTVAVDQPQVAPSLGWALPAVRKLVQGVNRLPWV